jgi:histidinol-phosphate aminotransferase
MASPQRAHDDAIAAQPAAIDPLALSLNENPFSPLPAVRSALVASLESSNRYPEFLPVRLRRLIADHIGLGEEQVVIGAGATGVVMQVLHATTYPGDRIVMSSPTFDGYPIFARMARLESLTLGLDQHGRHNLDAMADAAADARVVVLCRPHNPTATIESAADVERFLGRVPSDVIVLLDEAYIEFVDPEYRIDGRSLVERFSNVVVVRTFSKAYGLAGLRVGYGFGAPDLTRKLWSMQLPFGMGLTSMVGVAASYCAEDQLQQRIKVITAERQYLRARLRSIGVYSTDSHANFIFLPANGRPWREVFDGTELKVRHYADGSVRITIGTRPSSRAVLASVAAHR